MRILHVFSFFCLLVSVLSLHSAGVTIITHGQSGNSTTWVWGMAAKIRNYYPSLDTNMPIYQVLVNYSGGYNIVANKIAGGSPNTNASGEIFLLLDWGALAQISGPDFSTEDTAGAVVSRLLQTNFIAELNGRSIAELPIHLIGHSRGGSLVCAMAKRFGMQGIWVDQLTTLDPHPVNNNGNIDPVIFVTDAPLDVPVNVFFADNYFQQQGFYPNGQFMPSSYNRELTSLSNGYGGLTGYHSDVHLWYHATIDFDDPAFDQEATLGYEDRPYWYLSSEGYGVFAGYHYSRYARGDRFSTNRPAGGSSDPITIGVNQNWNFGAGFALNRVSLPTNSGSMPNPIRFNLTGTNLLAQGQTTTAKIYLQWAKPASSNAILEVFVDDDLNPYNGNNGKVAQLFFSGTTSNNIVNGTVNLNVAPTNSTPGTKSIFVKLSDGPHARYLYAPELLAVFSSFAPPQLKTFKQVDGSVRVDVIGQAGQRVVVERSPDLQNWIPIATNWLTGPSWSYSESQSASTRRFFRAVLK